MLLDADPVIVGVWDYLIKTPESEIRALPLVFETVDDLSVPVEAKWLIGFWLNKGTVFPCKTPSAWMREGLRPKSFWGAEIRERIASQQQYIRHWQISLGSYDGIENGHATWFIDPPYSTPAGAYYRIRDIDYVALAAWCSERKGQVIVCEQDGADWLPFNSFRNIKANESSRGKAVSAEMIWVKP